VSSNGHPDRQNSLSSDDDMIDITTTGTISERAMLEEDLAHTNSQHGNFTFFFSHYTSKFVAVGCGQDETRKFL
jgi:hypothetical protein